MIHVQASSEEVDIHAGKEEGFCFSGWYYRPDLAKDEPWGKVYRAEEHFSALKQQIPIVFKGNKLAQMTCAGMLDYLTVNLNDLESFRTEERLGLRKWYAESLEREERDLWARWHQVSQNAVRTAFEEYATGEGQTPETWNRLYLEHLFRPDIHRFFRFDFGGRPRLIWLRGSSWTKSGTDILRLLRDVATCRRRYILERQKVEKPRKGRSWCGAFCFGCLPDSDNISVCTTIIGEDGAYHDEIYDVKSPRPVEKENHVEEWQVSGWKI